MRKNAFVITNGCPENRIDCARIEHFLVQNGWVVTNDIRESNLIIFNACGLTEVNEDISINNINKLKRKKKEDSKLIVCGCLPMLNKERIKGVHNGDIFGGDDIKILANILRIREVPNKIHANYLIPSTVCLQPMLKRISNFMKLLDIYSIQYHLIKNKYRQHWDSVNLVSPNTFYIKVSSGCTNSCAYCAVKLSRGKIKSKPIKQIKIEFLKGLELGYKQFALIGTDTGSYGQDVNANLLDLLKELISIEGKFWIKLRNVHPRALIEMLPGLLAVFKSGKVAHMTTAVQHGNDRILTLMKRGYKIEDLKFAINAIRNSCPKLKIRTQLMVGFPGETDSEFIDTLRLVDEVQFDFIEVYKYSPRSKTLAAKMPNQLAGREKMKRYTVLMKKVLNDIKSRTHTNYDQINDNFMLPYDANLEDSLQFQQINFK
jgi:ribosomal protein S12 methylthiotransferase